MSAHPITIINKESNEYPKLLKQIIDPPEQLYCRGNIELLNSFCVGVIGTRRASDYGRQVCSDMVGHLVSNKITIVSGLALGIDALAHETTLNNSGYTIAVLGSGIEDSTIGPTSNQPLAQRILKNSGLIISEYEPTYPADKWTFPARNRIISGLSHGTLIIEADVKSGSLITAKSALEQDRDVFAVPGSIYWPRSAGTNWLIQQGARPVLSGADITDFYAIPELSLSGQNKNGSVSVSTGDPVQNKILAILKDKQPAHLDLLVAESGYDASRTMVAITMMEIKGLIKTQGAGIYKLS